jgi:hypothetical protein
MGGQDIQGIAGKDPPARLSSSGRRLGSLGS